MTAGQDELAPASPQAPDSTLQSTSCNTRACLVSESSFLAKAWILVQLSTSVDQAPSAVHAEQGSMTGSAPPQGYGQGPAWQTLDPQLLTPSGAPVLLVPAPAQAPGMLPTLQGTVPPGAQPSRQPAPPAASGSGPSSLKLACQSGV